MNIEDLVSKSKKGDISAFIELLKKNQELFYKIAFAYTKNGYDAEDCISEAAIIGFEKLTHLRRTDKFFNWFTSILINTCRKKYRSKEQSASDEELGEIIDEFSYSAVEDKIIIEHLLNTLKQDERELLVLRYLKDYSLNEIASIMDIPVNTVKTKIYRSINILRLKNRGINSEC
ncbi:sigma-70 family RNA polymerase sigma factor [Clostridium swellfunianum]|uniref:RNA polymerase sigma factor n=1 Tax=Clostridium swellfunianum TaxID=1367462 RepID=UPI00202E0908|nr:sigma-70 family RNA polymerase sigma factor [Clostridium swellfunianum]MCM0649454.1 sigma-70 family RNA polymerase sigma factor [Clostridium swellfunianum]